MKKYIFEITTLLFLELVHYGRVEKRVDVISICAKNYFEGKCKAIRILKEKLSNQSLDYANCVNSNWVYFNVRNTI